MRFLWNENVSPHLNGRIKSLVGDWPANETKRQGVQRQEADDVSSIPLERLRQSAETGGVTIPAAVTGCEHGAAHSTVCLPNCTMTLP